MVRDNDGSIQQSLYLASSLLFALLIVSKIYTARRVIWRLQKANLPMPQHSIFTGHLLLLKKHMERLPPDCTINTPLREIAQQFPRGMGYFDLWPFTKPILFVINTFGASQVEKQLFDKPSEVRSAFWVLTGGPNLFGMPQDQWKFWRPIFNPGFSASHMLELVPTIVRETEVFCQALRAKARSGEMIQLENLTIRLTIDVIAATVMETRLHHQTTENRFAASLRRQIEWTEFGTALNPITRYNFFRPLVLWYNAPSITHQSPLYLTLANYMKEKDVTPAHEVDQVFKEIAAAQLRLFLVAGHDTTSSVLIYCYHLLSAHPEALARARSEIESVLGPDTDQAASTIQQLPSLMNKLPYLTAVMKEALRLFPPASGFREGKPGVSITDENGTAYPTDNCYVWVVHLALHRDPKYFKDPDSFLPERWLVEPEDPLYPPKGAWRPFEFGPQNCIGQSLAIMEIKVVLALTVREFTIRPAYDEWDRMHQKIGIRKVNGNRAYQVEGGGGGAHPSDRYPCRVVANV
ncbi:aflN/ verA/ monooxygenase [Lophiostoma macrostomum CBS 122681]|uniref:AflN/ verA/ monooxygenase n=1 Tax=Lophiostoma macrostomum CBS 122681 TaxID=1314788 RepID=A0A6A6SRG9_9PLEO|nr:aflN/ verA/ monooxygenase [Lophiostoma macrostomum CBS 122681]